MLAGLLGATAAGAVLERMAVVGAPLLLAGVGTGELLGGTAEAAGALLGGGAAGFGWATLLGLPKRPPSRLFTGLLLAGLLEATAAGVGLEGMAEEMAGALLAGTAATGFDEGALRLPRGLLLLTAEAGLLARAAGGAGTIEDGTAAGDALLLGRLAEEVWMLLLGEAAVAGGLLEGCGGTDEPPGATLGEPLG